MAPEYFNGLTEHSIMASGEITKCTEKESFDGPMAEFIMENTLMIRNMGREYTRGRTDECTKVNFIMVNSMAKASTVKIMAKKFMASGKKARRSRYFRVNKNSWKSNSNSQPTAQGRLRDRRQASAADRCGPIVNSNVAIYFPALQQSSVFEQVFNLIPFINRRFQIITFSLLHFYVQTKVSKINLKPFFIYACKCFKQNSSFIFSDYLLKVYRTFNPKLLISK